MGQSHRALAELALARQELAEETGLRAEALIHLGHLFEAYGFSTQGFDVHLAEGLAEGEPNRETSEQDMIHRAFTDQEIAGMIRSGQIVDAPSLAALALFQLEPASDVTATSTNRRR